MYGQGAKLRTRCAKKVMSDSPRLVDFAIRIVIFVLNLPYGLVNIQVKQERGMGGTDT